MRQTRHFVPVTHSCGHVRGWGRPGGPPQGIPLALPDRNDMRVSQFVLGTGRYPCPWCGGAYGNLAPPGSFVLDSSYDQLVILDQPAFGILTVDLDTDTGSWTVVPDGGR